MARGVLEVPLPPRRESRHGIAWIPNPHARPRRRCPGLPVAAAVLAIVFAAGFAAGALLV